MTKAGLKFPSCKDPSEHVWTHLKCSQARKSIKRSIFVLLGTLILLRGEFGSIKKERPFYIALQLERKFFFPSATSIFVIICVQIRNSSKHHNNFACQIFVRTQICWSLSPHAHWLTQIIGIRMYTYVDVLPVKCSCASHISFHYLIQQVFSARSQATFSPINKTLHVCTKMSSFVFALIAGQLTQLTVSQSESKRRQSY